MKIEDVIKRIQFSENKRWEKMCNTLNIQTEPDEKNPDPLRIDVSVPELKEALKLIYLNVSSVVSDGIVQMRQHFPTLYTHHNLFVGKTLSQEERDKRGLFDDCFSYGELDHEVFATIFEKIRKAYGKIEGGVFYDLGCGVGQLVYAAAFIGSFERVVGIEYITALLERGEKKTERWNKIKAQFPPEFENKTRVNWKNDNLYDVDYWLDGTFYVLHWTSFSPKQREIISSKMSKCRTGTLCLTFTEPLPEEHFEILVQDVCRVSWGEADFFVQLKVSSL